MLRMVETSVSVVLWCFFCPLAQTHCMRVQTFSSRLYCVLIPSPTCTSNRGLRNIFSFLNKIPLHDKTSNFDNFLDHFVSNQQSFSCEVFVFMA